MAYSYTNSRGSTYYLHSRSNPTKDGKQRQLFYFSKEQKEGVLDKVPEGYTVAETANGLPVLKKAGDQKR